jgi:hypothetical protein
VASAALKRLSEIGVSQANILKLGKVLEQAAEDIRTGKAWQLDLFVGELRTLSVAN